MAETNVNETNVEEEKVADEQEVTSSKDTTETSLENEEELEEVEDSDEDLDFDGEDGAEEGEDHEVKKDNVKSEKNRKFAEMRRQQEEKLKKDAYNKGLIEGINGTNPYTNEKIEDDDDLEIYQKMREIEKRGGDPIEDYAKYTKIFKKEALAKQEEATKTQAERMKKVNDNIDDFRKSYPDIDLGKLLKNEDFNAFAKVSIDNGEPIKEAYERYLAYNKKFESKAEELARKKVAKNISTAGSLTSSGSETKKSFSEMTDEEFREFKRKHGYN